MCGIELDGRISIVLDVGRYIKNGLTTMYGYVWEFMGMYGYVWVCMGMYGYVWVFMGMYGYIRVCIDMYGTYG